MAFSPTGVRRDCGRILVASDLQVVRRQPTDTPGRPIGRPYDIATSDPALLKAMRHDAGLQGPAAVVITTNVVQPSRTPPGRDGGGRGGAGRKGAECASSVEHAGRRGRGKNRGESVDPIGRWARQKSITVRPRFGRKSADFLRDTAGPVGRVPDVAAGIRPERARRRAPFPVGDG